MTIFSLFIKPDAEVQGSYCDTNAHTHLDHLEDEEIDQEIVNSDERGDSVEFGNDDFHDQAINNRHDDDGRPIQQGPQEPN